MPPIVLLRLLLLVLFLVPAYGARAAPRAEEDGVVVHLFWRRGCPHCERAIEDLVRLAAEDSRVRLDLREVTESPATRDLFLRVAARSGVDRLAVPFAVIGERVTIGYDAPETTGREYRAQIELCATQGCRDLVARVQDEPAIAEGGVPADRPATGAMAPPALRLPLLGSVDLATLSLPALTVLLAAIDGFNPCAMWTLVFLLGLLMGMRDRLRMWLLGGAFIAGSAVVYLLFMAAWLNALLLLGVVFWVRVAVGVLALGGGTYYLREFLRNREPACEVTRPEQRRRILERLRALAGERSFLLAVTGILLLAFVVNLIELVCSAGIPAVYTQVLAISRLQTWQYYGYLLLYVVVFMLDDLIVFATAMVTLQLTGLAGRYVRYSHLLGGIVLLVIGALLILRPEWLSFG